MSNLETLYTQNIVYAKIVDRGLLTQVVVWKVVVVVVSLHAVHMGWLFWSSEVKIVVEQVVKYVAWK